jgi:hypothetical protein
VYHTVVVGADLECLVSAHDKASLAVLLVLQQPDVTGTPLLPLPRLAVKLEQLGAHLESLLLKLLVGLGVDLLGEVNDRRKVDIGLLVLRVLLLYSVSSLNVYRNLAHIHPWASRHRRARQCRQPPPS